MRLKRHAIYSSFLPVEDHLAVRWASYDGAMVQ